MIYISDLKEISDIPLRGFSDPRGRGGHDPHTQNHHTQSSPEDLLKQRKQMKEQPGIRGQRLRTGGEDSANFGDHTPASCLALP